MVYKHGVRKAGIAILTGLAGLATYELLKDSSVQEIMYDVGLGVFYDYIPIIGTDLHKITGAVSLASIAGGTFGGLANLVRGDQ